MKYLTANGKILSGSCSLEILTNLKNTVFFGANQRWENFLEALSLWVFVFYKERINQEDVLTIVDQLEDVGFLLRLE
ncbi:hypothetical protein [Telluribacter sp. SYSU D00476]|uniref:hypothetical protein n=1 Tax=Telluribacter sp. SYSU D00476 TaxID=2811430 RepID=UPI001FF2D571|nr:hypothetical protein [Telluribacter sp. SYSU D00476]